MPICATISGATVVPSAPSTLRLQGPPGIDAVTLAWTNTSTNADGFYLYEGDNTVATIPGLVTSYTLTGWNGAVQSYWLGEGFGQILTGMSAWRLNPILEGTFLGGCLFSGRAAGRHVASVL